MVQKADHSIPFNRVTAGLEGIEKQVMRMTGKSLIRRATEKMEIFQQTGDYQSQK